MNTSPSGTGCNGGGDSSGAIVVLGIGNVLWADEGFGVRCVEALQQRYEFDPDAADVQLIDGGTQGLYLIQHVQGAGKLLIFDAIDYGLAPGTLKLIENDDVPRFMGAIDLLSHKLCLVEKITAGTMLKEIFTVLSHPLKEPFLKISVPVNLLEL